MERIDGRRRTYDLAEAAARLGVSPATITFWEETFRDELGIARGSKDERRFTDRHLRLIRQIHRLVVDEGRSLDDTRASLRERPTVPAEEQHAHSPPCSASEASNLDRLHALVEFVLEENKALQELVARLIERIDGIDGRSPAAHAPPPPPRSAPAASDRPTKLVGPLESPSESQLKPSSGPQVRRWEPLRLE